MKISNKQVVRIVYDSVYDAKDKIQWLYGVDFSEFTENCPPEMLDIFYALNNICIKLSKLEKEEEQK